MTDACKTCGALPDAADRLRQAENDAVEQGALLDWVATALAGGIVSEFAESYPVVLTAMDLARECANAVEDAASTHRALDLAKETTDDLARGIAEIVGYAGPPSGDGLIAAVRGVVERAAAAETALAEVHRTTGRGDGHGNSP